MAHDTFEQTLDIMLAIWLLSTGRQLDHSFGIQEGQLLFFLNQI